MDQLSEIQTADMPTPPTPSGNARADSLARVEYEKQLTAYFENRGGFQQRGAIPYSDATAQPTRSVEPNADDLAVIEATRADLLKRYPDNNQAREILERAQFDVFAGKRLDREALSAAFAQAVETRDDREIKAAVDQLSAVLDSNGAVHHNEIPARLMHGYSLPPGLYDAEATVAGLKLAAELGLTQEQVNRYIELQGDE